MPPPKARPAHADLAALLRTLRGARSAASGAERAESEGSDLGAEVDLIRRLYDSILRERYDRPEPRLADLDQLRVIANGYPSRATFLAALALEPPQSTQDLASGSGNEDDALILSTAHSAKGKEWDAVFLIWAVDGWFPRARSTENEDELEEERRLMYVATTRARNHLAVTYPLHVYNTRRGADYSIDQLSRFLDRGVRERMQKVVLKDDAKAPEEGDEKAPAQEIDLRALLRGRFGGSGSV